MLHGLCGLLCAAWSTSASLGTACAVRVSNNGLQAKKEIARLLGEVLHRH
jgi:hypothetical protein